MDTEGRFSVLWMRQYPTDEDISSALKTYRETLGDICHIDVEITYPRYEGRVVRLLSYLKGEERPRETF